MKKNEKTFTHIVKDYINEKRAIGHSFEKAAQTLRRIIHLQNDIDHGLPLLSEELANHWIKKTAWENETNRSQRISILRGLGDYMIRMGYNAKVIPRRLAPQRDYPYTPYIFSEQELCLVLGAIDRMCKKGISRHSDLIFPIVFRILIGCGTRISETLNIEKSDIDLKNGTLILRHTKDAKERIIPVAASLVERCRLYKTKCQLFRNFDSTLCFFPNKHGVPYSAGTAYTLFRRALSVAGISHGGRGKGHRLHDLRHTYAVRVLNRWVQAGNNLTTALPYLAIYMGHEGMKASQHYLRLTRTMFPELRVWKCSFRSVKYLSIAVLHSLTNP
ncbi:MAG: tyrosine-type recombinase/integrase [Thermodesulfobacteriota bacterium]|nr:tyrosine-type recombinase/integrase [Thermodesulfobacteriota bacterium]